METLLIIIGCALVLVGIGVGIGYKVCADINGKIFQALYDCGLMIIKTDDGWEGDPGAVADLKRTTIMSEKRANAMDVLVPK